MLKQLIRWAAAVAVHLVAVHLVTAQQQDARFLPRVGGSEQNVTEKAKQPAAGGAADCRLAVIQIPSHGGSGTVIHSEPGRTLVLTAAHLFRGKNVPAPGTKMRLLVPPVPQIGFQGDRTVVMRKLAVGIPGTPPPPKGQMPTDDVALVEVEDGPWPCVAPLAPPDHKPGRNLLRCGYPGVDGGPNPGQRWPGIQTPCTVTGSDDTWIYTREAPAGGESGGALLDLDARMVVGVTSWRGPVPGSRAEGGGYLCADRANTCLLGFLDRPRPAPQFAPEFGGFLYHPRLGPFLFDVRPFPDRPYFGGGGYGGYGDYAMPYGYGGGYGGGGYGGGGGFPYVSPQPFGGCPDGRCPQILYRRR